MKHMKTVDIPATTKDVVDNVTCDLCGAKIEARKYGVDEVSICHRTGVDYPDSAWGEKTIVDMCGKCFDGKLIPWLRSQGAEPRTEDWGDNF